MKLVIHSLSGSRLIGKMVLCLFLMVQCSLAQSDSSSVSVGIDQKLGEMVDLDLTFNDEQGQAVALRDLMDGPTALTLVYYRCPGVCTPMLNEMASVMDDVAEKYKMFAGKDYRVLTISFDPTENENVSLVQNKKQAMLKLLHHEISSDGWRFMTGDKANIDALTDAVGFRYVPAQQDFTHKGVVIFLSKEGKIVSYLDGGPKMSSVGQGTPKPNILAMEMKLALNDAAEGTPRSLMRKLQGLCFSYDPERKTYGLMVNRIILGVGVIVLIAFGSFLVFKGKRNVSH